MKLETVLDADVMILPISQENEFCKGMDKKIRKHADLHGAWCISDVSHLFMVEESHRRSGWEYQKELIPNDVNEELVDSPWATVDVDDQESDEE